MKTTNSVTLDGTECATISDGLAQALESRLGMKKSRKNDYESEVFSSLLSEISGARTITIIAEK